MEKSMTSDIGEHDDDEEMDDHGDAEAPGHDENPAAITHRAAGVGVNIRRAFRGDDAHSNAQAQGRAHRRAAHLYQQCLVAAFAQRPRLARFRHTYRLHKVGGMHPGAARADRTANDLPFLAAFRRWSLLAGSDGIAYDVFHVSLSFLSIRQNVTQSMPLHRIVSYFCDGFVI